MTKLFISHSSHDDAFVRALRAALADHGQEFRSGRGNGIAPVTPPTPPDMRSSASGG